MAGKRKLLAANVKRVVRVLASGERRSYHYYRPTMQPLRSSPGTRAFEAELSDAIAGRTKERTDVAYVYFIQSAATGAVKIGRASDPRRRIQILQVGSPDVLTLLGWIAMKPRDKLERNIHGLFKADRIRGEWFVGTPELLDFIGKRCSL